MKIENVTEALDKLADVQWWMEGFAAARPPAMDEGRGEHCQLRDHAKALRRFLFGLCRGECRRIEHAGQERILISLPEFEALRDGLQPFQSNDERNAGILVDRAHAFSVSCRILAEYRIEERAANDTNVPF